MICATITLVKSPWIIIGAGVWMVALVLLFWSYRRVPDWGRHQKIAFASKLLGVLVLILCLIEPIWSGTRAQPGVNVVAVVADNSRSMTIQDADWERRRSDVLQDHLTGEQAGWLRTLAEQFRCQCYSFDRRLRRSMDFNDLTYTGTASALQVSLQTLASRYQGKPLAGIVVLTDGNPTDWDLEAEGLAGLPPVYPVVVGHDRLPRDLAVTHVAVTQTVFEDAPVTLQAEVTASAWDGQRVAVVVRDANGLLVEQQDWDVSRSSDRQVFRFRLRPHASGVLFYQVGIESLTASLQEATLANNTRTVAVDRGRGPYRVLYVTGRPNWEYKFLQRALSTDHQVDLVGLIRVAKREPKYDWRGRQGEQSNPLYRGFDQADEEQAEQYDQPVIVRLNTRDKEELRDGFPKTAEELFRYHALILDDVDAEFFTHDQMSLVRRFVSERGGGFLMLGGKESFQGGKFEHTPMESLLPVHLDRLPVASPRSDLRFQLTRQGWLEPWARLRDNEQAEQGRLRDMPSFKVLNRMASVKPGARVVATLGDGFDDPYPAVVVQRFGRGRSGAVAIGDIWRWGLRDPALREDQNKFWRQMVRWLIADVPQRVELSATMEESLAGAVQLTTRVKQADYSPMDNVCVTVNVTDALGQTVTLNADPVDHERGTFATLYVPRDSGGNLARVTVSDAQGLQVGRSETGWTQDLEALEFQSLVPNWAMLSQLAQQTGGQVLALSDLDDFARDLPQRKVPVTEVWVRPLWDFPGLLPSILVFVLGCLAVEWALRRWKGMP